MHFFVEAIAALLVAIFMGNMATAAPAHGELNVLEKRGHGWKKCVKHNNIGTRIPDMLPDHLQREIRCHPIPKERFSDSHCSNVFEVARQFCQEHAVHDHVKHGNKTYLHEAYLYGWETELHADYLMNFVDDYHVEVEKRPHCHEEIGGEFPQWKERTSPYDQCMGLLWASWSQCNNKGRGGWVNAGCYKYTLTTLD